MNISRIFIFSFFLGFWLISGCGNPKYNDIKLAKNIRNDTQLDTIQAMALNIIKSGFNAGDGYGEVWIRDYNTFIEASCQVFDKETIKENLRVFFRMQGEDGNIIDGFIPRQKAQAGYDYIYSELEPRYAGHKNTVETDQETSLIQAVFKYITATSDNQFLNEEVGGRSIGDRMEDALNFLMNHRYSEDYGLIWGATTVDWGDVQPEHEWGVYLTDSTHYAIDIYDNAMLIIALKDFIKMAPGKAGKWSEIQQKIEGNIRKYLWDDEKQKFIPHIYLNGSPFPNNFDENKILYFGGTAIAIEAGLLSKKEIAEALQQMISDVKAAGAASIGLTVYPPYPEGFFKNKGMGPYSYQNGGDWTWFGGRMIQQLAINGFINEAYEQARPMLDRVIKNHGFYEWYDIHNNPKGSGAFRGSAGVLWKAIDVLKIWSKSKTS